MKDLPTLVKYSKALLAALSDMVTGWSRTSRRFARRNSSLNWPPRVWKATPESANHNARVGEAVVYLKQLADWLGKDGLIELKEGQSLSKQVLDIFAAVRTRIPKRVFLARWYPTAKDGEALKQLTCGSLISRRPSRILRRTKTHLELVDLGTQTGTTFPIHEKMYDAITSADIILVDLTGVRPNVYVEAGFALRKSSKEPPHFYLPAGQNVRSAPFRPQYLSLRKNHRHRTGFMEED